MVAQYCACLKNLKRFSTETGYLDWLKAIHEGSHGNADLVAHFFRRAFGLIRKDGRFGLIATNTIGQGDTRATGLQAIIAQGGAVARAMKRHKWPGEAAVVVSVVHVAKCDVVSPILNGRQVRRVSAYLIEGDLDNAPAKLAANAKKAFQGTIVLGMGFTFDDKAAAKGEAESLDMMRECIAKDPRNAERIFPYLGGEEINGSPTHAHRRCAYARAGGDDEKAARILGVTLGSARLAKRRYLGATATWIRQKAS